MFRDPSCDERRARKPPPDHFPQAVWQGGHGITQTVLAIFVGTLYIPTVYVGLAGTSCYGTLPLWMQGPARYCPIRNSALFSSARLGISVPILGHLCEPPDQRILLWSSICIPTYVYIYIHVEHQKTREY